MNIVKIDWNLTNSCAAQCPGCLFGRNKGEKIFTEIPDTIIATWQAVQTVLSDTVRYEYDIVTPLEQLAGCDLSPLRTSLLQHLILNSPRNGDYAPIYRILSMIAPSKLPTLQCVLGPKKQFQYNPKEDVQQVITHMRALFEFLTSRQLSNATISFGQNQLPQMSYEPYTSAFAQLLYDLGPQDDRTPNDPVSGDIVGSILASLWENGFTHDAGAFVNHSAVHNASNDVMHQNYRGIRKWRNGATSFGFNFFLSGQIPLLDAGAQISQAKRVDRSKQIPLMLTPTHVYLHHTPETITHPHMGVLHETFQSWLHTISRDATGFEGLERAIVEYFRDL